VGLTSPRKFIVVEQEFSGMNSQKITELAVQMVKAPTKQVSS
jgi:hypothetical protein